MKVLLLSQFFSTTRGGGEYVFSVIAKKLVEEGHKVWVITHKISGENYKSEKNLNIILIKPELEYKGGLPATFRENLGYTFNAIKVGRKLIKEQKIDIIHSNNFSPSLAGSLLSFLTSKPHVIAVHDVFSLCGENFWKKWGSQFKVSKINTILAPFFEKLIVKLNHDCIHTVSDTTKDDLIKIGEKKPIYVIYNSLEEHKFIENELISNQFVFVGRLVFYKNLEVVFRAIEIIKKEKPEIKLIIIGNGPHKKELEKLAKELDILSNVEFKGYIGTEEKLKIISQSTALIFPSLCEGFGLVILEAFSQKKPVLVANLRPMSDIVSNGISGYALDPNDEKDWAEHMLKLVNELEQTKTMGENGFKIFHSKYNQDLMYQKLIEMYNDVLSKN